MKRHFPIPAAVLALGALLAGCGGSGGSTMADSNAMTSSSASGSMDAFVTEVGRILGMTNDTSEPAPTDKVNTTAPDNTAPAPVG
jgi:hypothetical protein